MATNRALWSFMLLVVSLLMMVFAVLPVVRGDFATLTVVLTLAVVSLFGAAALEPKP
jgi:hypothetical protein